MTDPMGTYLIVLLLGIALTVLVGQVLIRTGRAYLEDVFPDRGTAQSVSRLLAVLFHLVVLGVLALISTMDVDAGGALQTVVTKLGVVLLVLGAAHGATILGLSRIRSRRHEQDLADEMTAQAQRARRHRTAGVTPARTMIEAGR